ncbi:MAG TPA: AMP-binding protein [Cytophagales bacterium]|nr:AMP-binding protein [Cytophagales bacterium]
MNSPWFKHYPKGIPYEINPDQYISLLEVFEECFSKFADLPAFVNMDKTITFKELDELSKRFASYLQNVAQLKQGEKIAIQMPNLLQYPVALFGALRAGLVVVNTNPLYTPREMEYQYKDSEATAIVIVANFANNLETIIGQTRIKTIIVTEIGDLLGFKGIIVNAAVKYLKKMVPSYILPAHLKFKDVLKEGDPSKYKKPYLTGTDLAFLQYTGGTTGVSKGAMLTHRNMVANMLQMSAWMIPKLKDKEEIVITPLPMYHIFSLTVNCLGMLKIGAKNILITNPRDMKAFIKELKKYPFTVITGVNTLYNGLINQEDFKNLDFSKLKVAVGGGMAVQRVVAEKWAKITGTPIVEGYGLTETAPVVNCNPIDGTERLGYIGIPVPSTDVKIMDEGGNEVPVGTPGEICVKGPQVMLGYFQKEAETKNVFKDGWFKTGDIGEINEDGYFRIVDRIKDMIVVSGFKVFPNEVEDVMAAHPGVLEVAAIGIPDEKSTETVKLFVVKKDPSLTEEDLKEYAKKNLTSYKRPKYYEFRKDLPKSNVGKIIRRQLRTP